MNKLTHKGYTGSIEVSFEDNCLHGRVHYTGRIAGFLNEINLPLPFICTPEELLGEKVGPWCKRK